jgi:predicted ester cyclase
VPEHPELDVVRRFYAEAINGRDSSACERLLGEQFVHNGEHRGRTGQRQAVDAFLAAFDPLQHQIDAIFGERDLVCARQTWTGRHTGGFMGIPASGRELTFTSTAVLRVDGGLIVEAWDQVDLFGLFSQIGMPPVAD